MNKFKYYFILLLAGISLVSCNKSDDDEVVVTPVRDYAVQYKADNDSIVKYLNTNYITVTNAPGTPQDQDVVVSKITNPATQPSIMSYLNSATFPKLLTRDVYNDGITYSVYYLVLREGTGIAPVNFDQISTSYTGNLLNGTVFDTSNNLAITFDLDAYTARPVIAGWAEIFPKFKTGTSTVGTDGVIKYENFGAGMMFLPSGLAYYASPPASASIPAYSPLVFSFKLYNIGRADHDRDGVYDYEEDLNHDGYVYDFSDKTAYPSPPKELIDDTDGDGIADFLDVDDDGDGYTTLFELTKPTGATYSGISKFYPYDPILDNPNTPNTDESEIWGIPRRPTGALTDPAKPESITNPKAFVPEDYTAPGRLRIHVDKTYPYQKN